MKKKMDVRSIQSQNLTALGPDLLLVWKSKNKVISIIRSKEFILAQHTTKEKSNKKSLFEQAAELLKVDNTTHDSWYSDWILQLTNTHEKVRKVEKRRMPKEIKSQAKTKANFFKWQDDGLKHLKRRKTLITNEVRLSATANKTWFDPIGEEKGKVRLFPRPGGEDLEET